MSDDLIDRVAHDLAAGRLVDWAAALASAGTPAERMQLESLRVVHQIARRDSASASTVAVADTAVVSPAPAADAGAATTAVWGRYRLLEEAGSGSYGTVYRAVDPALDLDIAIK